MKTFISKYAARLAEIPEPLSKQIYARLGFSLIFFMLFIAVLCIRLDPLTVVPFIGLSLYSLICACLLFFRAAAGGYVVARGRCVEVAETLVRKRTKSVLIETGEHTLRVFSRKGARRIAKGAEIEIYIADDARVYESNGVKLVYSYMAIDTLGREANGGKDAAPGAVSG